ncbi:ATP synthase F1 subunit gamma [Succinispira mobilis]|uniref:ATP synthase F1 subunit gamma n=1 Tax=Succinispira mobilis TaxID=78120 RepID=UPI00036D6EAA|nr:ATP synthase F1 subunit gamma [Succinispira mobilis]
MASSREIRRRIKSVKNIQQITKAMKMVAAARLRRAQEKANASKPYATKIKEVLSNVVANTKDLSHPLLEEREVKKIAYFIVSADKGLAGSYNSNLIKAAVQRVGTAPQEDIAIVTLGRKAFDYFRRRNYTIDNQYTGFSERPTYQHAVTIANEMTQKFVSGEYDEIHVIYTKFYSPLHHEPTSIKVLPVETPKAAVMQTAEDNSDIREYIFEPSPEVALEALVPRYLEITVYAALMQSAASELGARMAAMGSATDNARDLIAKLTLNYNKLRQAGITREISEIVGGAEALK